MKTIHADFLCQKNAQTIELVSRCNCKIWFIDRVTITVKPSYKSVSTSLAEQPRVNFMCVRGASTGASEDVLRFGIPYQQNKLRPHFD